jgi:hypothetical protein
MAAMSKMVKHCEENMANKSQSAQKSLFQKKPSLGDVF